MLKNTLYDFFNWKKKMVISKKLYIGNEEIIAVPKTKFLGTIIDQNLKWGDHISHIKKKVAKGLGIISKAKKYLNTGSLRTLYYSFVYPYFDYCIEVWGSAAKSFIEPLFRLQKKAIRMITLSNHRSPSAPLFERAQILTLTEVHYFKIALFMFRHYHDKVPIVFNDFFIQNDAIHEHNTRTKTNLHQPLWKSEIMKKSIRIKGVYIWNHVNSHIAIE